jgi:peptidoglycan/LPS O-acetylase OafA/YrhL
LNYRKDIDGLRAYAVLAVIIFHAGFLPMGYLGVDVFFVISGFLITNIIYSKFQSGTFSIYEFYVRRTRRILPLVLVVNIVVLLLGCLVMMPDHLENLAQSVIATNFFSNNILQNVTTGNYWDVVNDFKPLLHTWSLGVEEQFYIIYPLVFIAVYRFSKRNKKNVLLYVIGAMTLVSLLLFVYSSHTPSVHFLIHFRFFELALGGLFAIRGAEKRSNQKWSVVAFISLIVILCLPFTISNLVIIPTVVFSAILLNGDNKLLAAFLENKAVVFIGKISFSLYMWHQVVLAFARYFVVKEIDAIAFGALFIVTFLLSVLSYYFVEQPFRNAQKISVTKLWGIVISGYIISSAGAFYLYSINGIVKDVPELGIVKGDSKVKGHSDYNDRVYNLDKPFSNDGRKKMLVVGNSFARDFVNVLIELGVADSVEIVYVYDAATVGDRGKHIDYLVLSTVNNSDLKKKILDKCEVDTTNLLMLGTKNFGYNNGYVFNQKSIENYCTQRVRMEEQYYKMNEELKKGWGNHYLDIIGVFMDAKGEVPVFTPDCRFISQDCRHFTSDGAKYFGTLIKNNKVLLDFLHRRNQ